MFVNINNYLKPLNAGRIVKVYLRYSKTNGSATLNLQFTTPDGVRERQSLKLKLYEDSKQAHKVKNLKVALAIRDRKEDEILSGLMGNSLKMEKNRDLNLIAEMEHWANNSYIKEQSKKNVLGAIRVFKEFLGGKYHRKSEITKIVLLDFKAFLLDRGREQNSARQTLKNVKRFFKYHYEEGNLPIDPTLKVTIPEEDKEIVRLTESELKSVASVTYEQFHTMALKRLKVYSGKGHTFLAELDEDGFYEVRDSFMLACKTALRPSDIMRLLVSDVKGDNIVTKTKKTGTLVNIPLLEKDRVLIQRHTKGKKQSDLLFRLPRSTDRCRVLRLLGKVAKVDKPMDYRIARRTFASLLADKGVPIMRVSRMMGHSNTQITEKYYATTDERMDREALDLLPQLEG